MLKKLITRIWLSLPGTERIEKYFINYFLHNMTLRTQDIVPHSDEGKEILKYWFDMQHYIDARVSRVCGSYYDRKHPKHYMWLGMNQYLYDGVKEGERVLDIGCGASFYQQWIAEKAASVVGVDIRQDRIDLANRNNKKKNVHFELLDVMDGVPDDRFDVAICSHVLEHLDEPVEMLSRLAEKIPRVLVKVPMVDSNWMKLVKRDIGMFWMDDPDHRREYTEELLREHLEEGGWQVVEIIRGHDLRATAISRCLADSESYLESSSSS